METLLSEGCFPLSGTDFSNDQLLHHVNLALVLRVPHVGKAAPLPAHNGGLNLSLRDHDTLFEVSFCWTNLSSKMGAGRCPSVFDFLCHERSGTVIILSQLLLS